MPKKTQIKQHAKVLANGLKPDLAPMQKSDQAKFFEDARKKLQDALKEEEAMKYPDEKRISSIKRKLWDVEASITSIKRMTQTNSK